MRSFARAAKRLWRAGMGRESRSAIAVSGGYPRWAAGQAASTGYAAPAILDKALNAILKVKSGEAAYERDTVLFDAVQHSFPLLASLLLAGSHERRLSVLDFGGALGSSYFQNRAWLQHLPGFSWGV